MKLIYSLCISTCLLFSCSRNSVEVENDALGAIEFFFRGKCYPLNPGERLFIEKNPYQIYEFSTAGTLPSFYKKGTIESSCAGKLTFKDDNTKYLITYKSSSIMKDTSYVLFAYVTTNAGIPISEDTTKSRFLRKH